MGILMDMALFVNVDDCGMNMMYNEDSQNQDETENSCCDDEVSFVTGQDDLQLSWNDLNIDEQYFLIAFEYSYRNLLLAQTDQSVENEQYPPPLLVKDIQLFDEVYLI